MSKIIVLRVPDNNPLSSWPAQRRLAPPPLTPQPEPWTGTELLRVQRDVSLVCRLGDRPVFEVRAGIARDHNLGDEIAELLGRFAALDPDHVALGNGDRFAPHPLMEVPSWMPKS